MTGVSENSPHCDTHLSNCSSVGVALSLAVSSHLCFFVILFLFLVVKRYFQISPHPIIYRFSVSVLFPCFDPFIFIPVSLWIDIECFHPMR